MRFPSPKAKDPSSDYVTETRMGKNGRPRRVSVYRGPRYVYARGDRCSRRREWLRDWLLLLIAWGVWGMTMCLDSHAGRVWYAVTPAALCFAPLSVMTYGQILLCALREPFTREDERSIGKKHGAAMVFCLLSGLSLLFSAVLMLCQKSVLRFPGDLLFLAGTGVNCALGLLLHRFSREPELREDGDTPVVK